MTSLLPNNLRTIKDVVSYLKEVLDQFPELMNLSQQEKSAAAIVGLFVNDRTDTWEEEYPLLTEILSIASDLEWSNTNDHVADWKKIAELTKQLAESARNSQ